MSNHSLRKFTFRQVLVGKALRPSNMAICIELDNYTAVRFVGGGGHTGPTQELTRFAGQVAEYHSGTQAGAEHQFLGDFPKMKIVR